MTTTFETAKVGDRVWCMVAGWGEVQSIDSSKDYPIAVRFNDDDIQTYTVGGFFAESDIRQTLFWDEIVFEVPVKPISAATLPADEKQISALRDQIAIAYMQAQVQAGALYETWDDLSGDAYKLADAMLKERDK